MQTVTGSAWSDFKTSALKPLALLALTCFSLNGEIVTYSEQVAPILYQHCALCHRPGEAAPFSLLTYMDARKRAVQIAEVTQKGIMPPWMPEAGHGDFKDSPRLAPAQVRLLVDWAKNGTPEGDPAKLPAQPVFNDSWELGPPDLVIHMKEPYKMPAVSSDIFRNFVLPVDLKETKYIRAFELRPSDKRVIHHANMIVDRSRLLRRNDGEDGQPGFPGMDVVTEVSGEFDPDSHFLFWKPGTQAQQEPEDMAWRLDPSSDLVLNLHLQATGKPELVDASVGLYFAKDPPQRHPMLLQLEDDGAIDIAPGSTQSAVTDHLTLPIDVHLMKIYPHAHYLGRQIDAWAELPGGKTLSLLKISNWDLNWQATYTYKEPVALPARTKVFMRIQYDNSDSNVRNPNRPPREVKAGDRAVDEMGHVWLQVLPDKEASGQDADPRLILQEAVMERRIEKYPADFVAHFNLGAALLAEGKPDRALSYLKDAVRIRPDSATARNNVAVSLLELDQLSQAEKELRATLALDPNYSNARYNLARTLAAKGDSQKALQELSIYLKAVPHDAQALELSGRLKVAMHQYQAATADLREAAELEPNDTAFLTNLGSALALASDFPGAVRAFESALKIDPTNQVATANLARARKSLESGK
jgi:Flp pilus assembly protein TadD